MSEQSDERRSTVNGCADSESEITDDAVVVIGGHPPDRRVLGELPARYRVICADSGLDHAIRLGLSPDVVIGDMDSVDHSNLVRARDGACAIIEHPTDKDFTDTELALEYASRSGFRHLTLVWGGGDRIDHVLGVMAALAHTRLEVFDSVRAWISADRIDVLRAGRSLIVDHDVDTTISLMTLGASDAVVTTRGLKWDLHEDVLTGDRARGVSNRVSRSPCSIHCDTGIVAVVSPGHLSDRSSTTRTIS
ncbi:MAG: putative thiamine pyrophosphokinae [Actinomycetota bacterium]|jgi:thiamine pyrophosphokinase